MNQQTLRMVFQAFADWNRKHLTPSGRAVYPLFEARANALITAVPEDGVQELIGHEGLSDASILAGMEWLLDQLRVAFDEDANGWASIAAAQCRLLLHRNIQEIAASSQPPDTPRNNLRSASSPQRKQ